MTALHLAVREGDEFSACFLVRNGANVNLHAGLCVDLARARNFFFSVFIKRTTCLAGDKKATPLHMAAEIGLLPVIRTLLEVLSY
jgi:ankyrin repeat protein